MQGSVIRIEPTQINDDVCMLSTTLPDYYQLSDFLKMLEADTFQESVKQTYCYQLINALPNDCAIKHLMTLVESYDGYKTVSKIISPEESAEYDNNLMSNEYETVHPIFLLYNVNAGCDLHTYYNQLVNKYGYTEYSLEFATLADSMDPYIQLAKLWYPKGIKTSLYETRDGWLMFYKGSNQDMHKYTFTLSDFVDLQNSKRRPSARDRLFIKDNAYEKLKLL